MFCSDNLFAPRRPGSGGCWRHFAFVVCSCARCHLSCLLCCTGRPRSQQRYPLCSPPRPFVLIFVLYRGKRCVFVHTPAGAGASESTASEGEVAGDDDSGKTSAKQPNGGETAAAAALPEAAGSAATAAAALPTGPNAFTNSSSDPSGSASIAKAPGAVAGEGAEISKPGGAAASSSVDDQAVGQGQRTEVVPGPVWGGAGGGGVDWGGRQGVGGGEGAAEAGTGAGLEVAGGGVSSAGGGGNSGEWDAGDGTVALRHLQNLAAQLPYGAWQVRVEIVLPLLARGLLH